MKVKGQVKMEVKKNPKSEELLRYGVLLKENSFGTERGLYTIRLIKHKNDIFFHKMKDGDVVEIKNLSKEEKQEDGK